MALRTANPDIATWFVLGVPRLHHLLATDRPTSKDGAGRYVVEAFGERWRPLVTEVLTYRATGEAPGVLPPDDPADHVIGLADQCVASGLDIRL